MMKSISRQCFMCIKFLFRKFCTRRVFIFILLLPFIVYYCVQFYFEFIPPPIYMFRHLHLNTQCIIPEIDPFDDNIMKHYTWHPDPIICDDTPSILFIDYEGILQINRSTYPENIKWDLDCAYSLVEFIDGDKDVRFLPEVKFSPPIYLEADVFLITCKRENKMVYKDLLHKIDFKTVLKNKIIHNETDDNLSVLMFALDSISRLTAIRKLPKTMKYLQKTLKAYVFKGYNKVGENTYPNLIPLLTGNFDQDESLKDMDKVDFIWKKFSNSKYVTMHAEDWPEINTLNMGGRGFHKNLPTVHYLRRFFLAMRKVQPLHYNVEQVFLFIERYVQLRKRSALCFGNRKLHMVVIEYIKQFMEAYRGKLKFAFGWLSELSHNFINFIEAADQDFYELFKWLYEKHHLNKTVLIFYSDHGSRQDEIRNTYIGRIEDRMPLLSIVIPEHIQEKYPHIHQNLEANTKTLTATFDVHQTLKDILHSNYTNTSSSDPTKPPWGKSLFEAIPKTRSCLDAQIPENYCSCYSQTKVDVNDKTIRTIAKYVTDVINEKLQIVRNNCATLSLSQTVNAAIIGLPLQRTPEKEIFTLRNYLFKPETTNKERYLVTIETVPGKARFESTVNYFPASQSIEVIGSIDRINRYGNQSICIEHQLTLRPYCYCV